MDKCRECGVVDRHAGAEIVNGLCQSLQCHRLALGKAKDLAKGLEQQADKLWRRALMAEADLEQARETRDAAQAEATRQTLLAREAQDRLTAYMKGPESSSLDAALGTLRHAYSQALQCRIGNQDDFAEGLLAPAIRLLEQFQRYEVKS